VRIIDREVIGKPLTLGEPEHLAAGEVDHPADADSFGRQQHMPGPQHVNGHDVFRTARAVVGKSPKMHHSSAALRRTPDRSDIPQIIAVDEVIAGDIMAEAPQMSRYRGTHVTAMPRDQNPHHSMISRIAYSHANRLHRRQKTGAADASRCKQAQPATASRGQAASPQTCHLN
jgi:hypothetical protein